MSTTKILIALFLFTLPSVQKVCAQTDSKDVFITTSGSGSTIEDATQAALRSATEQAFGAFISSKTEMFNDQVVADQMASVSSGNVKSFEILNQDQLPDGRWGVTLKAIVSIDKLTSFVEAKGIAIEIKGGMFALNIKQQLLNEQGEIKAVAEMVGLLHEPMQIAFDYVIKSGDPLSIDEESKNWAIPLKVSAICNKNMDFCANYFIKTLAALSLTAEEVETYKSLNKRVYQVMVTFKGKTVTYHLRKQASIRAINSFISNWTFYTMLFSVESGLDEITGRKIFSIDASEQFIENKKERNVEIYAFTNTSKCASYPYRKGNYYCLCVTNSIKNSESPYIINDISAFLNFPTSGQNAGTFSWRDLRTLSQIEKMTGYSVKPRGVVSYFKGGGYVVGQYIEYYLIVSLYDLGEMKWDDAHTACADLTLNGYSDWRLPEKDEMKFIVNYIINEGIGCFNSIDYWINQEDIVGIFRRFGSPDGLNFNMGFYNNLETEFYDYARNDIFGVRAVRVIKKQ